MTQDIPLETNISLVKVFGGTASGDNPIDIKISDDGFIKFPVTHLLLTSQQHLMLLTPVLIV